MIFFHVYFKMKTFVFSNYYNSFFTSIKFIRLPFPRSFFILFLLVINFSFAILPITLLDNYDFVFTSLRRIASRKFLLMISF